MITLKWNQTAILAATLTIVLIAGPVFAEEGRTEEGEIVEEVVEVNATEADPWVIAPSPEEEGGDEESPPLDEGSGSEAERPVDEGERPTADPPEDDTTIGIDDSDAKGEPLIAPAGNEERDALPGDGDSSYLYLLIPALLGVVAVGIVLVRRRH